MGRCVFSGGGAVCGRGCFLSGLLGKTPDSVSGMRHTWEMQTTCFCFDLAGSLAHTYRNRNTHLSGCLIIKEESPGACSTLVRWSPVGVLLQIPHSPIITTINHDTQPPAPGVGWVGWGGGLLPALNTCDSSVRLAVPSEAESHMEVSD